MPRKWPKDPVFSQKHKTFISFSSNSTVGLEECCSKPIFTYCKPTFVRG